MAGHAELGCHLVQLPRSTCRPEPAGGGRAGRGAPRRRHAVPHCRSGARDRRGRAWVSRRSSCPSWTSRGADSSRPRSGSGSRSPRTSSTTRWGDRVVGAHRPGARRDLPRVRGFTRYCFRAHGDYTTLAEELRSIDRYPLLERARFGDRLGVILRIAPEVLPVRTVPSLQPLVENAVGHGLEGREQAARSPSRTRTDRDRIGIEDDGLGKDPGRFVARWPGPRTRSGWPTSTNDWPRVRRRYGLVVETADDAGTRVIVRLPK